MRRELPEGFLENYQAPGGVRRGLLVLFAVVAVGMLLLAGYLRFDAAAPWTGRTIALIVWGLLGLALVGVVRRASRAAARQLQEPDGDARFAAWFKRQKLDEWHVLRQRGRRSYIIRTASWLSAVLWAGLYSVAMVLPSSMIGVRSEDGALTRAGAIAGIVAFLSLLLAITIAHRQWARALQKEKLSQTTAAP